MADDFEMHPSAHIELVPKGRGAFDSDEVRAHHAADPASAPGYPDRTPRPISGVDGGTQGGAVVDDPDAHHASGHQAIVKPGGDVLYQERLEAAANAPSTEQEPDEDVDQV